MAQAARLPLQTPDNRAVKSSTSKKAQADPRPGTDLQGPLDAADSEAIAGLREILKSAGYTETNMRRALGAEVTHILRVFEAEDYLFQLEDLGQLLDAAFRLAEENCLEQTLNYRNGEFAAGEMKLRLKRGLAFQGIVDACALHILSRCDGRRSLSEILAETARSLRFDAEQMRSSVSAVVRRLFVLGFLVRVQPGSAARGADL